jgi:hypothetical protein
MRFATYRVLSLFLVFLTFGSVSAQAISLPQATHAALDYLPKRQTTVSLRGQRFNKQDIWQRTELYFGTQRLGKSDVTDREFFLFVDEEITPRFPDGLTLLTGYGQFRNAQGDIIQERSKVLILFFPRDTKDADKKVEEIRAAYKKTFSQESVLRVDSLARISF